MRCRSRSRNRCISLFLTIFITSLLLVSCKSYKRNSTHSDVSLESIRAGESLADKYCQSCHLLPSPDLLDSKTWEKGILPNMGPRLGIFSHNFVRYPSSNRDRNLGKDFYPSTPLLTAEQWQNILDYYEATSPDTLSLKPTDSITQSNSLFSVKSPSFSYENPATSFIKFDTSLDRASILMGDFLKKSLYRIDNSLNLADSLPTVGTITDIQYEQGNKLIACNIGFFAPTNEREGEAVLIEMQNGKLRKTPTSVLSKLQRPVQISPVDLNKDGKVDYLALEFGYLMGSLSWFENRGDARYEKHVLKPLPGAIKAYINDYNSDGLPDVWALFAQGNEGVFLYTNKRNGKFDERQVLQFPPVYGSSYFEFADFNKDGHPDIIYTCGDNADYSPILKPYHGVYIFINDGSNNFTQQYFFHLNGCYKAIARDFDNDGDLDIATISYFADFSRTPQEGFVYLENQGNLKFNGYSVPGTEQGRWMTMDAGDINGDGKIDLVLGNFSVGPTLIKSITDWEKGPPFIVLENKSKKHF